MPKESKYNKDFHPLTKKRFMQILTKAAQPVVEGQHDQEAKETSVVHHADDYIGKCKNQDKTVNKEGLPSD